MAIRSHSRIGQHLTLSFLPLSRPLQMQPTLLIQWTMTLSWLMVSSQNGSWLEAAIQGHCLLGSKASTLLTLLVLGHRLVWSTQFMTTIYSTTLYLLQWVSLDLTVPTKLLSIIPLLKSNSSQIKMLMKFVLFSVLTQPHWTKKTSSGTSPTSTQLVFSTVTGQTFAIFLLAKKIKT